MTAAGQAAQAARGVRLGADTLSRLLDDLCKPASLERRREGERHLLEYVEAEARDLSADAFSKFMQEVYARLQAMIKRCGRRGVPALAWRRAAGFVVVRAAPAATAAALRLPAALRRASAVPLLRPAHCWSKHRSGRPSSCASAPGGGNASRPLLLADGAYTRPTPPAPRRAAAQPRRVQAAGRGAGDRRAHRYEGHRRRRGAAARRWGMRVWPSWPLGKRAAAHKQRARPRRGRQPRMRLPDAPAARRH